MNATTRPEQTAVQRHDTEDCNTSQNPSISDIIDARLSRRSLFKAGFGTAGSAVLGTVALSACGGGDSAAVAAPVDTGIKLAFPAVPKSTADVLTRATGYTASVIYALGDPLTAATPDFKNDGTDTDYDNRAGDHHDGMEYFGLNAAGTGRDANSNRPWPAGHEP
jgi:secreted PhoX family phosphatase